MLCHVRQHVVHETPKLCFLLGPYSGEAQVLPVVSQAKTARTGLPGPSPAQAPGASVADVSQAKARAPGASVAVVSQAKTTRTGLPGPSQASGASVAQAKTTRTGLPGPSPAQAPGASVAVVAQAKTTRTGLLQGPREFRVEVGVCLLILTVLNGDSAGGGGGTMTRITDCSCKRGRPKVQGT